jgi:hypothetical protein
VKDGGGIAAQMGAPLTAHPIDIEAFEVSDDRWERSVERQRSAQCCRSGRFAGRPELARARATRLRRLHYLPLGPAAIFRIRLKYGPISSISMGVRDPVD